MYASAGHREAFAQQMQAQAFAEYAPRRALFGHLPQSHFTPSPLVVYQNSFMPYTPQHDMQQHSMSLSRPPPHLFLDCQQYRPMNNSALPVYPKKKILAIVNPVTNEVENKDKLESTIQQTESDSRSRDSAPSSSVPEETASTECALLDDFIDDDKYPDTITSLHLDDDLLFPSLHDNGVSAVVSTVNKEDSDDQRDLELKASLEPPVGTHEANCSNASGDQRMAQQPDAKVAAALSVDAAKCAEWEKWMCQLKADKNEVDIVNGVLGRDFLMLCGLIVRERNEPQRPVSINDRWDILNDSSFAHDHWNPFWRLNERMAKRERIAATSIQNMLPPTILPSSEDISIVVNAFFEKAVEDKKFFPLYCNLCKDVMLDEERKTGSRVEFHRALLNRCKTTFDQGRFLDLFDEALRAEAENDQSTRAEHTSSCQKMEAKERARIFGTIGFIGHIYIEGVSPSPVVRYCLANLFLRNGEHNGDAQMVECAVRLLLKVGSQLDVDSVQDQSEKRVSRYYSHLSKIRRKKSTSLQLQRLIDSLLQHKLNNWVS
uniref:MIF4G domain-containing protein n=1 Tax=Plectus sambesii TaxID=2011161 RepID=A0A914W9A0_9BILA